MSHPDSEVALAKSARGSAYNLAVSSATILLGFTRSVLLMRLLGPEPFGLMALALFFSTFLAPIASLGVDTALVQKKDAQPGAFSTHFVLRVGAALAALGASALLSSLLRRFYPAAVVDLFLFLLAVNLLEATFATPGAILRREMRFGAIALLNLAASLAMTILAPLLAYLGAGVWSLAAEQAAGPVVRWFGLWIVLRPWRPSLRFHRSEAKTLAGFGSRMLSSHLLGVLLERFDDFWTGTALGAIALGYYSRAYEVAQYPERVLATPVTTVFFSAYAALQADAEGLSQAFRRASSFLVRAGFLLAVALAVAAPEATLLLFGEAWLPIVPVFRLLLVYVLLNPFYTNLSYLLVGAGAPGLLGRVRLLQLAIFSAAVVLLANAWGIRGVAAAADLMMLIGVIALAWQARRFVRFSLRQVFLWPSLAALAGLACWPLAEAWAPPGTLAALAAKAGLAGGAYALTLFLGERQTFRQVGRWVFGRS